MTQKELKTTFIAIVAMIAMLGALCIVTPAMAENLDGSVTATRSATPAVEETKTADEIGCDDLDQNVLIRYDFDKNGLIDSGEMEKAKIGYESNYEKPDDYAQILYAYEHQCPVSSTPTPTRSATPAVEETKTADEIGCDDLDRQWRDGKGKDRLRE